MPGQVSSSGQGSLNPGRSVALTGIGISSAHGTVIYAPGEDGALIGNQVSVGQGTLTFSSNHGQQIASGRGFVSPTIVMPALAGLGVSTAIGTLTVVGSDVSAHLSGAESEVQQGLVAIGPVLLTGEQAGTAAGSLGRSREIALAGMASALAAGSVAANIEADDAFVSSRQGTAAPVVAVAVSGQVASAFAGTVGTFDKQEALTGIAVTASAGTVAVARPMAIVGQQSGAALHPFGAPGYGDLTGQQISVGQGFVEHPGNARTAPLFGVLVNSGSGVFLPRHPAAVGGGATRRQHVRFRRDVEHILRGETALSAVSRPEFQVEAVFPDAQGLWQPTLGEIAKPLVGLPAPVQQRVSLGRPRPVSPVPASDAVAMTRRAELEATAAKLLPNVGAVRRPSVRRPRVVVPPVQAPKPSATRAVRKTLRELEVDVLRLQRRRKRK